MRFLLLLTVGINLTVGVLLTPSTTQAASFPIDHIVNVRSNLERETGGFRTIQFSKEGNAYMLFNTQVYEDDYLTQKNKYEIVKFSDNRLTNLGSVPFKGYPAYLEMQIGENDNIYLAYSLESESPFSYDIYLMKYQGGSWSHIQGSSQWASEDVFISSAAAQEFQITLDNNDAPYLSFFIKKSVGTVRELAVVRHINDTSELLGQLDLNGSLKPTISYSHYHGENNRTESTRAKYFNTAFNSENDFLIVYSEIEFDDPFAIEDGREQYLVIKRLNEGVWSDVSRQNLGDTNLLEMGDIVVTDAGETYLSFSNSHEYISIYDPEKHSVQRTYLQKFDGSTFQTIEEVDYSYREGIADQVRRHMKYHITQDGRIFQVEQRNYEEGIDNYAYEVIASIREEGAYRDTHRLLGDADIGISRLPFDIRIDKENKIFAYFDEGFHRASYRIQSSEEALCRFYSEIYKGHFYTNSTEECTSVKSNSNWKFEGKAYPVTSANDSDASVVYRFWNESFKHHFYTSSLAEKNELIANNPSWAYEGEVYHVYNQELEGTTPVYRFWSDSYKGHFYTTSGEEKESIEQNDPNWLYEGIAWYVQN